MRSALAAAAQRRAGRRSRSNSLNAVPPAETSRDYLPELAAIAASILYRSPLPSSSGLPVYIVNAAAFPDSFEIDYDSLLPYVLARLPGEEELINGQEYEVVFFAGGTPEGATTEKKQGPGIGWYLQAYHVLSRATRKKLQKLYIVHPRTWVRVLVGVFGTIVSPKFRRKIVHVNTLTGLALHIPVEKLLIPPPVYLHDRKLSPDIYVPYATGRRAFATRHPFPKNITTGQTRLPRVLRETTNFLLLPQNVRTEGLFRIPPHSTLAGVLKEAYDRGQRFIVWKEKSACVVEPGTEQSLLDEVRLEDAYGVHLAAALIKTWYRELREPIFSESSYDELRRRYGSPDAVVTSGDLVDLVYPASPNSPLSAMSREILTRHLLPLLSAVRQNEEWNKMNAENLAICFAMALVCGSNQLEDAKMTTVIRRILEPAIEIWPQLSDGMGIGNEAFSKDLQAPADSRDYEDPLEDGQPTRMSEDDVIEGKEGHRIVMTDAEEEPKTQAAPRLPPRLPARLRALSKSSSPPLPQASSSAQLPSSAETQSSAQSQSSAAPAQSPIKEIVSAVPKRKPAPPIVEPPRYSTIFGTNGNSNVADSPASYGPVDGFGPPRRSKWSYAESEKKGFPVPTFTPPTDPHPALASPRRKAVSTELSTPDVVTPVLSTSRSASEGTGVLAKIAAQKAAEGLAQRLAPPSLPASNGSGNGNGELRHEKSEEVLAQGDGVFRKPAWPASARPSTLAKPVLPPRQSQTVPIVSNQLNAPSVSRPRAPSPGLLKRMSVIEPANGTNGALEAARLAAGPRRLNLKKASVDDLRRLYEERAGTAKSLERLDAARRGSQQL